jgi:ATP-dependent RNA helicase DDX19/DBP5
MSFSITYDLKCMEFAEVLVPDPIIISLKKGEESLDNIQRYYVKCAGPQEKYNAVTNIYGTLNGQAIIFCHVSISVKLVSLLQFFS